MYVVWMSVCYVNVLCFRKGTIDEGGMELILALFSSQNLTRSMSWGDIAPYIGRFGY